MVNNLPANAGRLRDTGSIPGLGRCPGGEHGNPLQYFCVENPMDKGAWPAAVHRIAQSGTPVKQHACAAFKTRDNDKRGSTVKVLVAQLCPTLCEPMNYSPPGSSVHGIFQARILEWVAIPFSRRPSQPRDRSRSPTLQADSLPSEPQEGDSKPVACAG